MSASHAAQPVLRSDKGRNATDASSAQDLDDASSLRRPGFLAAPFSATAWRETFYNLLSFPLGVFGFSFVTVMLTAGAGTIVTFVGLPVLSAGLAGARGLAAVERVRARSLLGLRLPNPEPVRPTRPGLMGRIGAVLKSGLNWRAALYQLLMLPVGIVSFTLAVTLWSVACSAAAYPLYQWVFPHFAHQPGLQIFGNNGHNHYLSSVPEIAGTCAAGLVLLFLTPWVMRGVANLQRVMVRGLLTD